MVIKLFNRDNQENTKVAVLLLVAGAFFFIGVSRLEIIDKLDVSPWLLIAVAIWLTIIVIKRNKRHRR